MIAATLIEAAARSFVLALLVAAVMRLFRVHNPHVERMAWSVVLIAALVMPLAMSLSHVSWITLPEVPTAQVIRLTMLSEPRGLQGAIVYLYFGVAAVLLLRHAVALVGAFALRRCAVRVVAAWTRQLDVRACPRVLAPVSVGNTILVPLQHAHWSQSERDAVLAHEHAHIRHRDFLIVNLAQLHRALFWFNPLAWWLPRRLALLSEHLSDDAALATLDDRAEYVKMLLGFSTHGQPPVVIAMARPATVSRRVERILTEENVATRPTVAARLSLMSAVLAAALLIAACRSAAAFDVPPKSNPKQRLAEPEYPADARLRSEQGTVVMRLYVRADGRVGDAQVEESSGFLELDASALRSARDWRLDPALLKGKPVAAWGQFAVTFKLID